MTVITHRLTYANVMATVALFVALGGTSWAATRLARNSVGSPQIRTNAVGSSEIRARAVRSSEISDRSVRLGDLAASTRSALRGTPGPTGPQGPAGPQGLSGITYHAAINSAGSIVRGNARSAVRGSVPESRLIRFERDIGSCQATATLAVVPGGIIEDPPPGRITVRPNDTGVEVRTFGADGSPALLPFNLIVAC